MDLTLEQVLNDTPYRVFSGRREPDPLSLFRGRGGSPADVTNGWTVPRNIRVAGESHTVATFGALVSQGPQDGFYLLAGSVGEGKTTLLSQLSNDISGEAVSLLWHDLHSNDPEVITDCRRLFGKEFVLLVDIPFGTPKELIVQLAMTIRNGPRVCPIVVAGSGSELRYMYVPDAIPVGFDRLSRSAAERLCHLLSVFYNGVPAERLSSIQAVMPNLKYFVDEPKPSVFTDSSSLLEGMLRATLGDQFRARLYQEYVALEAEPVAKQVYRWVCYFGAVGRPVPLKLFDLPDAFGGLGPLDTYGDGSPMLYSLERKREHVARARSPLIAEAVLLEGRYLSPVALSEFLGQLLDRIQPDGSYPAVVHEVLNGYVDWRPLDQSLPTHIKGTIRRAIRTLLRERSGWLKEVFASLYGLGEWTHYAGWASLFNSLLPDKLSRDEDTAHLLKQNEEWLERAAILVPEELVPRFTYLRSKAALRSARFEGDSVALEDSLVLEWGTMLKEASIGIDFLVDVASLAASVASRKVGDEAKSTAVLAATAFERALAVPGADASAVRTMYAALLRRFADESWVMDLLREAWQSSIALRRPNPGTGCWLAKRLIERGDMEPAANVLRKILAHVNWGEAVLLLAALAKDDVAMQRFILERVLPFEEKVWYSSLNGAMACHAVGRIYQIQREREHQQLWLGQSCDLYELAAQANVLKMWAIIGEDYWKEAAEIVDRFSAKDDRVRVRRWLDAKSEVARKIAAGHSHL